MKKILATLVAAAILSGCTTITSTSNVEMSQGRTASYDIPAAVLGNNVNFAILDAYSKAVSKSTGYAAATRHDVITSGVIVKLGDNRVTLAYVNHNDTGTLKNDFVGDFAFDIARKGETVTAKVACPSSMVNDTSMRPGMTGILAWMPFIPKDRVAADVNAICDRATMQFNAADSGEVTTEFKESSVLANFARKFQETYSMDFHESEPYINKAFIIQDNNTDYRLLVSVYPYRNGSKLVYRTGYAVTCAPNRGCTGYDPAFAKRLREKIAAVAND